MSTWAREQRIDFIREELDAKGYVNRADLMGHFGISIAQASIDIREFKRQYPKAMRYNLSAKRYEATS